ncbi:MAG: GyrI-like domain-containing protein [Anaerolineae bacterium]
MAKLTRIEFGEFGPYKVVGKVLRSGGAGQSANPIPAFWGRCLQDGTLSALEHMTDYLPDEVANIEVGYMTDWQGEGDAFVFDYVVGRLMSADAPIPEGYRSYDFPRGLTAMAFLEGEEPGIYEDEERLTFEGMNAHGYEYHGTYAMEVYVDHNSSFRFYMPCRKKG